MDDEKLLNINTEYIKQYIRASSAKYAEVVLFQWVYCVVKVSKRLGHANAKMSLVRDQSVPSFFIARKH